MDERRDPVRRRVLAIDDEPGLREMLEMGLAQRGYEVATAADGDEGLDKAKGHPYDLVVCDILMPGKSGLEVLVDLKKIRPEAEIIMATGHATLETAIESMKLGAYDYITKPYTLQQLCVIFDRASERRQLRRRVGDLEELDRLKTQFLAYTSHELRTPLNCILGFQSLLLNGVYGPMVPRQQEIVAKCSAHATSLLGMITNLLDMSKLAANKMELFIKPCDVAQLVRDVAAGLEPLAVIKKVELRCEAPASCIWPTDAERLKQILVNLSANALKFTNQGHVGIRLAQTAAPAIEISIEDTGIGIKPQDLPTLFEDFRQLDSSATRHYNGTGLGLSISRQLAGLLGGRIDVKSQFGAGSLFKVILPMPVARTSGAGQLGEQAAPAPFAAARKRVLIADDDQDCRQLVRDILARAHTVLEATDGTQTLEIVSREKPDLVLLDVSMPGMNGWDVAKRIRQDPATSKTKIIIFSAYAGGRDSTLAAQAGCDDYIMKPCDPVEVARRIALHLKEAA